MFFTLMLLMVPVLCAGLLAGMQIMPPNRRNSFVLWLIVLAMCSSIQLGAGYENVHVDLTFFVLVIANLALLVHLMLQNKVQMLKEHNDNRAKCQVVLLPLFLLVLVLIFQGFALNITDAGLYFYHINVFVNVLLLGSLIYILSRLQLQLKALFLLIVCFSMLNSLLGILQYVFNRSFLLFSAGESINYYEGIKVAKRVVGFVGANNGAGNLAAIFFPVLLYYLLKRKSMLSLLVMILNTVFLFFTFTRIGYLSVCVQVVIFLLFSKMGIRYPLLKKLGIMLFAVAAFVLAVQLFYEQLYQVLILDRGNTESQRFIQFGRAFHLVKEHPWFGLGAGQYIPYMQMVHGIKDITLHSQFMNVLIEQGIFSLALFTLTYVLLFIWSMRKFKGERWLPLSLFIGNFIVVNFNPNQYYSMCTYTFFMIAFGLVFAKKEHAWKSSAVLAVSFQNGQMEPSKHPNQNVASPNIML